MKKKAPSGLEPVFSFWKNLQFVHIAYIVFILTNLRYLDLVRKFYINFINYWDNADKDMKSIFYLSSKKKKRNEKKV